MMKPTAGRKQKNENDLIDEEYQIKPEALNTRALAIINRVNNKLTGTFVFVFGHPHHRYRS